MNRAQRRALARGKVLEVCLSGCCAPVLHDSLPAWLPDLGVWPREAPQDKQDPAGAPTPTGSTTTTDLGSERGCSSDGA